MRIPKTALNDFPAMQMVRSGRFVRVIGWITFTLIIVGVIALVFVPWRQTAKGTGVVLALDPQERVQAVTSPAEGIVSMSADIREGSFVGKNDVVLRVEPFAADGISQMESQILQTEIQEETSKLSKTVAEEAWESQQRSGENLRLSYKRELDVAQQKLEEARAQVSQLQADLEDKENKLRIAKNTLDAGLETREKLFSKQKAVEGAKQKMAEANAKVKGAQAALSAKQSEVDSKNEEIEIKIRMARQKFLDAEQKLQEIGKKLTELRQKQDAMKRGTVRAPRSGFIQKWYGLEGSNTVKKGQVLFEIVPDATQLVVEMSVSGNDMPLIQPGDPVRLQFEGWPGVQFAGWPSAAAGTFGGKVNRIYPTDDGQGNFKLVVLPKVSVTRPGLLPTKMLF
ncbi:MAG: HlyD family efflux transporter periplasmic adaptor subunit, partial [Planctomycetota bacterium]